MKHRSKIRMNARAIRAITMAGRQAPLTAAFFRQFVAKDSAVRLEAIILTRRGINAKAIRSAIRG